MTGAASMKTFSFQKLVHGAMTRMRPASRK